jgi:hypothetical protein
MPGGGPAMGMGGGSSSGNALSVDLPLWSFFGYCVLLVVGEIVIIPTPWIVTAYYRWLTPRLHVPGRPNLGFTGQVGDIWYVFIALPLLGYVGYISSTLQLLAIPAQAALSWMVLRWFVSHLTSNGQPLPITFDGSIWMFIGFQLLMFIAIFTIIGWAWVISFFMRWVCRNVGGTRREIVFSGTGLQVLWRTIVFSLACILIIPIPWMIRWYAQWYVSQTALVQRGYAQA